MPHVRKLSPAEAAAAEQRPLSARAHIAREYDAYLADFAVGDYGRVELAESEPRNVVRSRLHAAARRRGLVLRFRPGPNPALIFRVEAAPPAVTLPVSLPAPISALRRNGAARGRGTVKPRPLRRRESSTERYHEVLPRWMRGGDQPTQRRGSKRRAR